jgi:hypothetical protein
VEGCTFLAHRAVLLASEFFRVGKFQRHRLTKSLQALLTGGFREARGVETCGAVDLQEVELSELQPETTALLLEYLYADRSPLLQALEPDAVQEVARAADRFLLPGLKQHCGAALAASASRDNCLALYELGEDLQLPRVSEAAVRHIAEHLALVAERPALAGLLEKSAATIRLRSSRGDTVPLADEILSALCRMPPLALYEDSPLEVRPAHMTAEEWAELAEWERVRLLSLEARAAPLYALLDQLGIRVSRPRRAPDAR